jgi:hypothetical protein
MVQKLAVLFHQCHFILMAAPDTQARGESPELAPASSENARPHGLWS